MRDRSRWFARYQLMFGCAGLLHAAVITPGTIWFRGDLAWWIPGAAVVALPGLIGAWREAQR
ncbi:hypothetical protein [Streptomyces rectiverticillatus]|uniref:hypothetical protein n=1 Tax=Streptomyces rectiverticillatus TaxID=173860 RepID=UPI001FE9C770|nr:hypothetical protein [Streptomyces rectiverticillatus]